MTPSWRHRPPPLIRACNGIGSLLDFTGIRPLQFCEDRLIEIARRRTGLEEFGDASFREPLRVLLDSYENESRLNLSGRLASRTYVVMLLVNRLLLQEDRERNPEIAAQQIRRPLFIIGLPRTGTTLLHGLLSQDLGNRVPLTWEVMLPSPPPARETRETDPRIAQTRTRLRWLERLAPDFKIVHPYGARLPQECIAIMTHAFASIQFHTTHAVPSYQEWLVRHDLRFAYRYHREFLQHLQYRCAADRWVLKAPGHLFSLDALFAVYPDACMVMAHRDPLEVVASISSLQLVLRSAFSDHVDPRAVAADWSGLWALALERAMQTRKRFPERFCDVYYRDVVRDPIAAVRQIYQHFDLELGAAAEARMRRFLSENPKDKHGAHQYSLAQFGLDPATEQDRYAAYYERFKLPP